MSFQIHCPAVQNKRSSEGTPARCTSAHRVPRQAYLLRRPLPVDRATSGSPVIRPAAATVLAAAFWTTTGTLPFIPLVAGPVSRNIPSRATSKQACSLLHGLRRPGHNSSFPAAPGIPATRARRLSAATGRARALGCHLLVFPLPVGVWFEKIRARAKVCVVPWYNTNVLDSDSTR